ncbi:MAG: AAA family ATPase [Lachnospiraceae bacterium]
MKICELLLKNFGKFENRSITLSEGIQLLYGENESGKSTLHSFIKGMFFGMERGRGRAANHDIFTKYEPWGNPNYYAGRMIFETGGRHFILERNFDKYGKNISLVCQEDLEELSPADGDLDMLLNGLTPSGFDDTISVAQLRAKPGTSLAAELKNYATNYYVTGGDELDLEKALKVLKERKKEAEKKIQEAIEEKQKKRDAIEQEMSYVWRDIHRLTEENDRLEEEIACRKERMENENEKEPEVKQRVFDEIRPPKWRVHPVEILIFAAGIVASFLLIPKPWNSFVTIVLLLCGIIYIWNRMKISKQQTKTEPELILEEITPEEEKLPVKKLLWEFDRNAEELREKQIQYENLKEALEELCEVTDEYKKYENLKQAVQLASERITELSGGLRKKLQQDLDVHISEIISEITDGKYEKLILGEELTLSVISEGKKIPAEYLSQGTIEQIYFALRMAAAEVLHEEEYPVILDDAFVCYDEQRLNRILKWLHQNKKQVLLFTCQKREEEALKKMGIPFRKIVI